jgi:hypothetical protein
MISVDIGRVLRSYLTCARPHRRQCSDELTDTEARIDIVS